MKRFLLALSVLPCIAHAQIKVYNTGQAFTCIATDKNGEIWAGTQANGLWKCRRVDVPKPNTLENDFGRYSGDQQFNKVNIQSIATDQNAHVWVGHNGTTGGGSFAGGGVDVFTVASRFTGSKHYTPYSRITKLQNGGIPSLDSKAVTVDKNGTVWTANGYHDLFVSGVVAPYIDPWGNIYPGIPAQYILTCGGIAYKKANANVFDTINTIAAKIPYGAYTVNTPITKSAGTRQCLSIGAGPTEVWAGVAPYESEAAGFLGGKILRFNLDGSYKDFFDNTNSPLPQSTSISTRAIAIYFQKNGTGWVGFNQRRGFGVYKNGTWSYVDKLTDKGATSKLLPAGIEFVVNSPGVIAGKGSRVFLGTTAGLIMYKGKGDYAQDSSYVLFTTAEGLPSNNIRGVATDEESVWVATDKGIARIPINDDLLIYHLNGYPLDPLTTANRTLLNSIDQYGTDDVASYIAADSSEATLFVFTASNVANLKFAIEENANDQVEVNRAEFGYFKVVERGPDTIKVQYHHPRFIQASYLRDNKNGREVTLQIIDTTTKTVVLKAKLKYVLPPVLIIHGVWSSTQALEPLSEYLRDKADGYRYFDFQLLKAWRTDASAEENPFPLDAWEVPNNIRQLIENCAKNNLSAGKVNVVCHSRGGLYTRAYIEELMPNIPYRYDINSLITLNTPHAGSQYANLILDQRRFTIQVPEKIIALPPLPPIITTKPKEIVLGDLMAGFIPAVEDRISKNGARVLRVDKGLITDLNEQAYLDNFRKHKVPVHAFATNFELCRTNPVTCNQILQPLSVVGKRYLPLTILLLLLKAPKAIDDFIRDDIFNGEKNDFIVPKSSMEAGLNARYLSRLEGENIPHSDLPVIEKGITATPKVHARVAELLQQNLYDNQSNFSLNGYDPPRGASRLRYNLFPWLSQINGNPPPENGFAETAADNPYVLIDTAVRGKKLKIADTLKTSVYTASGIKKILIVYEQDGDGDNDKTYTEVRLSTDNPVFKFPVPANFYGKVTITVYGFGDSLLLAMDTSHILVGLPAAAQLLKIMIDGEKEISIRENETRPVTVRGLYSDSVIRTLTTADSMRYVIRDSTVLLRNGDGDILGKQAGYTNLIAVVGKKVDSIQVNVTDNPLRSQTLLDNFTGSADSSNIQLSWLTYQEFRNAYFIIERGNNGRFDSIGAVKGSGTLYTASTYAYQDTKATGDTLYYRLRIIDSANNSTSSRMITILKPAAVVVVKLQTSMGAFSGVLQPRQLQLSWNTQQEYKLKYFAIQRSTNGFFYDSIGAVKAKGTSVASSPYGFVDSAFTGKILFYRLKLVDSNQATSYSEVLTFQNITTAAPDLQGSGFEISMYPNPAGKNVSITAKGQTVGPLELQITNLAGQTFFRQVLTGATGTTAVSLQAIPQGLYVVEIRNTKGKKLFTGKLVIQR